jgi:transposase-like protein
MHQNGKLNLYSQVFKDAVLREVREQKQSVTDIAKLYNVSAVSIYRWMKLNEVPTPCREVVYVDLKTNRVKEDRIKELERKVQNLERALSDKVLENCVLQGMINVAQKKYGLDLKKKTGTME